MKTFDLFFPDLMPLVPGCPEMVAERALMRAAQRFCELSLAWRVVMDPITTEPGTDVYELDFDRAEMVRIESAKYAGRDIKVKRPNENVSRHADYIECLDGLNVAVNPVPTVAAELLLTLTLKPAVNALGVEDFIFGRYGEIIVKGAQGTLQQHPQKTYTSADGPGNWAAFESRCADVKLALWRGLGRNTPRTRPSWY